jgi:hypothetical protein
VVWGYETKRTAHVLDYDTAVCTQVVLAELALRFSLSVELLTTALSSRLGTHLTALMDGGLLYTPAYVSRLTAQVRSARPCARLLAAFRAPPAGISLPRAWVMIGV